MNIRLDLKGPYCLDSPQGRRIFNPPERAGIYLWTIKVEGDFKVAYIGEAQDLSHRLYQHFYLTLGGGYELYSPTALLAALPLTDDDCEYKPSPRQMVQGFLECHERLSHLALKNLQCYTFFWAELPGHDKETRLLVESALITAARKAGEPIQNTRLSRRPNPKRPIRIHCSPEAAAPSALLNIPIY